MLRNLKRFWKINFFFIALMALVLVVDQASKLYYINLFEKHENPPYEIFPFFNVVYVWNKGVSFGMFANFEHSNFAFIFISILVTWYFIKIYSQETNRNLKLSYSLIIGGAIGNIIDRIKYGAVFDFIDIHVSHVHWPAFNVADSCITIGAILLIYNLFYSKIGKNEASKL